VVGRPVTVTATGTCGAATPTYQFWHLPPGGSWTLEQAYSTTSTFNWDTTGAALGTHQFQIWARGQGSSASSESSTNIFYSITASDSCTSVASSASPASPAVAGQLVSVMGTASCGTATPQYQFWYRAPGGSWTIAQAYGSSASYSWDTTGASAGTHQFQVWARAQGSSASYEAFSVVTYVITLTDTCSGTTLVAAPASPAVRGTSVTWTASTGGCATRTWGWN